ncbi:hypothetical protein D3C71_831920 [compost metagenome]
MGGQHIGQSADLASAHGVRLPGQRKRAHTRPADAAGGKVAIDDGVDLVRAALRLVDALAVTGDGFFRAFEQFVKGNQFGDCQAGGLGDIGQAVFGCCLHRSAKADRMVFHIAVIDCRTIGKMRQQADKQRHISIRADGEMHIGNIGTHRPARIDDDDLHLRPCCLCRGKPLIKNRMAPGEIGTGEDHQIGKLHILIGAGHRVSPESAAMAGDRRRHAKS